MFLQVCFVDANWDSSSIYIHCMILFYFWLKKGFIIDIMFRRSIFIDLWVLYFFQILEYYHEAFVPILKGLALFFFLFTQSTLAIGVENDPEKIVIQLWGGWDKVKLLLQYEIKCNIKRKIMLTQIFRRKILNGISKYLD